MSAFGKLPVLLAFIENLSIEDKLYWKAGTFELAWNKIHNPSPWMFRDEKSGWLLLTGPQLLEVFERMKVDMPAFEQGMTMSVLAQVAFADAMKKKAALMLGEELVERSIAETQAFMDRIQAAIEEQLGPLTAPKKEMPKLQLVKEEPVTSEADAPKPEHHVPPAPVEPKKKRPEWKTTLGKTLGLFDE